MKKRHSPCNRAKFKESVKGDEFYTKYSDVRQELDQYPEQFRGKTIFCPCDSSESAFVWYFNNNFEHLGIKRLMAMSYGGVTGIAEKLDITAPVDDLKAAFKPTIGTGDFRSAESRIMMKECDVIATNPPFSLKDAFVRQIIEAEKQFCIILPTLSVGCNSFSKWFKNRKFNIEKSISYFLYRGENRLGPICSWFCSWPLKNYNDMTGNVVYEGHEHEFYKDSYGRIICNNTREIPREYYGIIGVPITSIISLDTKKWEYIGHGYSFVSGQKTFDRQFIRRKTDEDN